MTYKLAQFIEIGKTTSGNISISFQCGKSSFGFIINRTVATFLKDRLTELLK